MCLTVYRTSHPYYSHFPEEYEQKELDPMVANKDIVCWKVVFCWKDEIKESEDVREYNAPYYNQFAYVLNKEYICDSFCTVKLTQKSYWMSRGFARVEYGFHSFATLAAAERELEWWEARERDNHCVSSREFHILECVIPKGTRYYRGFYLETSEHDHNSYCSEKITALRMVE